MRLPCFKCGFVANADPWLHEKRYGHVPEVRVSGKTFRHRGDGSFGFPAGATFTVSTDGRVTMEVL